MHETMLTSSRDTLLVALPFIGMLMVGIFRLDELIVVPREARVNPRRPGGMDVNGDPIICDPDGRVWKGRRRGR